MSREIWEDQIWLTSGDAKVMKVFGNLLGRQLYELARREKWFGGKLVFKWQAQWDDTGLLEPAGKDYTKVEIAIQPCKRQFHFDPMREKPNFCEDCGAPTSLHGGLV